ncbi:hypothetical protein CONLIGDRAFT_182999 [Coniochaeta ligniaria NRRL 30616]|uniref:Uncharacterized protein n=1 Tax=Coniochaeta ligniaria NRRL 30616 TaxID=1408157 RepID=A0A1J7J1D0_9PEZI|nr:hypothetical protein CONLIGDRAFT_182999 [Coniochaeta ligniaria NRRL 30616]
MQVQAGKLCLGPPLIDGSRQLLHSCIRLAGHVKGCLPKPRQGCRKPYLTGLFGFTVVNERHAGTKASMAAVVLVVDVFYTSSPRPVDRPRIDCISYIQLRMDLLVSEEASPLVGSPTLIQTEEVSRSAPHDDRLPRYPKQDLEDFHSGVWKMILEFHPVVLRSSRGAPIQLIQSRIRHMKRRRCIRSCRFLVIDRGCMNTYHSSVIDRLRNDWIQWQASHGKGRPSVEPSLRPSRRQPAELPCLLGDGNWGSWEGKPRP